MRLSASSRETLALGFCVLLSALASVQGLGFSSDDWDMMAAFANARSRSLPALFMAGYHPAINHTRPGEILYQATLYWLLGPSPLGYHVINAIVLAAMAMLLAALLHELGAPRVLALVVPLVYAFLPHYASARFWIAAFIAIASQALCFLSLYCDLRAARNGCAHPWRWKVAGLVALIASALTYEVTLPLFLLGPLLTWYRLRQGSRSGGGVPVRRRYYCGLIGSNVIALIAIGLFKYRVSVRIADRAGVLTVGEAHASLREAAIASLRGMIQGVFVNFGDYGIGLPHVIVRILQQRPVWSTIALAILAGIAIFSLLSPTVGTTDTALSWVRRWRIVVMAGVLIFALGYAIFATNRNVQFTPTGISNRTATAAALGVAVVFVGLIGRGATLLPSASLRGRAFCACIAALCASGLLINLTIAAYWRDAYTQEQAVLATIRRDLPELAPGSTLILDGVCPYVGPAIVFESSWDLAGALKITYHDPQLAAAVVTPNLTVGPRSLSLVLYRTVRTEYPYGPNLLLFNITQRQVYRLSDADSAARYFQAFNPDRSGGCPRGSEGFGVPVFPSFSAQRAS